MKNLKKFLKNSYVLVLDVGTTGIKAFVFDDQCHVKAKAYKKISKTRPRKGWVEQDPREILRVSCFVLRCAIKDSCVDSKQILGMGITNQREATVVWNRKTGKPVYPVIGWEDDRTRAFCDKLKKSHGDFVRERTGLTVDPYFSASKIRWILQNVSGKDLAFGTLDSWLIWNLCENNPHIIDETNAARTLLFDIRKRKWSDELLELFDVPKDILPKVFSSRAYFGNLRKDVFGFLIPILAVCGDQQASAYAAIRSQPASRKNITKITYGTGVFVVQTINRFVLHPNFFTTLVPTRKGVGFALEGKIEKSGEKVTSLLSSPNKLRAYLRSLALDVDQLITKLPTRPRELVVDGGSARDGIVTLIQQEVSHIPVFQQTNYDGTALGTAMLVWDSIDKKSKKM
jgi:glycerol kinase